MNNSALESKPIIKHVAESEITKGANLAPYDGHSQTVFITGFGRPANFKGTRDLFGCYVAWYGHVVNIMHQSWNL